MSFLLSVVINIHLCYSQSAFTFKYSTLMDERPLDAIETEDNGFIITASTQYTPTHYQTLIFKLNSHGDTINTITLTNDSSSCFIADLVKSDDGNYFGIGGQKFPQETKLWLIKINSNLSILMDTTYSIGMESIEEYFGFIDHFHNLVIYGCGGTNPPDINPYLYRLTQNGDSLSFKFLLNTSSQFVFSMIEKPDTSGYYMMILGHYEINTNTPGEILSFDYELNEIATDSIPSGLDNYYNSKKINDHEFIITGKKHIVASNPRTDLLGIIKLDTSFIVKSQTFFGPQDTVNYPGYLHNLDFIDTSQIYYSGTCNQAISDFSNNKSFYILGKFDSDLTLKWQKYYGGDIYYTLWGILATSDHGCLLIGSTYNYLTQNMERNILVIKVDSNGMLLSNNDITGIKLHNLIVYPNPGSDYMAVETGPQAFGADFTLYDLTGRPVLQKKIVSSPVRINTQSLLPGIYFYRAVKGNQVIESGKWVKY
jgi:hypothetical protein